MLKSCRDAGWLQGCRVVALMQGGCRDVVIAEMGVVAGLQGGCRDGMDAGMQSGCRAATVTAVGMG